MESGSILVVIFQWIWVTIVALLAYLFRKVSVMDKEIGLIKKDMEHGQEQRTEMLETMKQHTIQLNSHSNSVLSAINRNSERLKSMEDTLSGRHHASGDG
jgi:hypothetical protein